VKRQIQRLLKADEAGDLGLSVVTIKAMFFTTEASRLWRDRLRKRRKAELQVLP
jgi:hypothetical protein